MTAIVDHALVLIIVPGLLTLDDCVSTLDD